jgi:hypothetical protein
LQNPIKELWTYVANNQVSVNPIHFLTEFQSIGYNWFYPEQFHWASYNLGEVSGLSGWWSLVPLIALWTLGLAAILKVKNSD